MLGGALGLAGVVLIFWPEFGRPARNRDTMLGARSSSARSCCRRSAASTASRNRLHGLPFWPSLGYGMLYGAAASALIALLQGHSFVPPALPSWWLSLLYLALAGSVLTLLAS